jgi:beta-mannosidase
VRDRTPLTWTVGHHRTADDRPGRWVDATVPGAVQLDLARAEGYPPWTFADNWKDYRWTEDVFWTYRARFDRPQAQGERIFFVSLGIDYAFDVLLNGIHLLTQEGMYTPVELDLTDHLQDDNELRVVVHPAPKLEGAEGHAQADRSCKPPVSYGWDWHPRLIPLGIWDETFLEARPAAHLRDVRVRYELSDDLTTAHLQMTAEVAGEGKVRWEIIPPSPSSPQSGDIRELVTPKPRATPFPPEQVTCVPVSPPQRPSSPPTEPIHHLSHRTTLTPIQLWWPREQGPQPLYTVTASLQADDGAVLDRITRRIGFRRTRLVMNAGTWNVEGFPKSRSVPPMTLEINGRRVFCKGTNWVNPEVFYGTLDAARYEELIDLACAANFNTLRVWGGAIVNKRAFHDLCDERGLMVWQDFPLACNEYSGTTEYLAVLRQEAMSIVRRLEHHPSLVLWCGGNELFNHWSLMTDQSAALRLLNAVTFERTPEIPFISTSPLMGVGHGHYVFRDHVTGEEVFEWMGRADCTAYPEFGCAGPADAEVLRSIIPAEELFPPGPGTAWEDHHAFGAWSAAPDSWLMLDTLEHYFGRADDLEQLVERGQLLQSEGYRCIYEEARRQWPRCSMALNWCFDEPWPAAANNSLITWPSHAKPALAAVGQACRPVMVSARLRKFTWTPGEVFVTDVFVHNDLPDEAPGGRVRVWLEGDAAVEVSQMRFDAVEAGAVQYVGSLETPIPAWRGERFDVRVEVVGRPDMDGRYTLLLKR